jgi:hypothetical protein
MCFSASASFGAGIVLSAIGIASIKKAQTSSQMAFACIPLIFSVQQITEGYLWLSLSSSAYSAIQPVTTYIFLFFAQVLWPVWVPVSILMIEKDDQRKKILKLFVATGTIVSAYLTYCLLSYHVEAKILGQHISYQQDYPSSLGYLSGTLYIIATVASPFFSTFKRMPVLASSILVSYIITEIFYEDYIVSVWCFFAAIISVLVLAILHENKIACQRMATAV